MKQLLLSTSWGDLRLVGGSRAGEASLLLLPQLRLALDTGRPARALVPMQHVVVTHGHLDHLLGLPGWASQRHLQGMPGGVVYAPAAIAGQVEELIALFARLEGGAPYDVRVLAVAPGDARPLRPGFALHFFATSHWVETIGCRLEWTRKRLRPELAELSADELRRARTAGREISEELPTSVLAYLGDTGPQVFDAHPWLASVEVLVVECTFLRPDDRDRATRFGHMHLDDLVALAPHLGNRHLVLTHLSRRHRLGPGTATIRKALGDRLVPRLHFFNVEWE
jgi:ribonuclease Z